MLNKCIKCDSEIILSDSDKALRSTLKRTAKMINRLLPLLSLILESENEYCNECFKAEVNQIAKGLLK